jgi:nucleoside-diphosphate-sugar epimerase
MAALSFNAPLVQASLQRIPAALGLSEGLSGRHLLLTGGTGFFGLWLLALLHQFNEQGAGIEVTVVSRNPARFLDTQPQYRDCAWLRWLAGDVRDLQEISGRPPDLILHAAVETSAAAHNKPLEIFDTILGGARRVLDLAVRSNARRILLTGSGAQYGALPAGAGVAENYAGACVSNSTSSAYGEAKRAQEALAAIYAQDHGLEAVMTRCFAFAGPGLSLDGHFAIGNFVRDALRADAIVLNSAGEAVRSYLHGADLAAWLLFMLAKGKPGQAYNVGSDQAISIADLAVRVGQRLAPHKPVRILGRPGAPGARSWYVPDIGKAQSLGLSVWTDLDASIDSMAAWAGQTLGSLSR